MMTRAIFLCPDHPLGHPMMMAEFKAKKDK